jgi:hypothetical protein
MRWIRVEREARWQGLETADFMGFDKAKYSSNVSERVLGDRLLLGMSGIISPLNGR